MKKIVKIVCIVAVVIAAGIIACTKESKQEEANGLTTSVTETNTLNSKSPELKHLLDYQNEIALRVIGSGISKTKLLEAMRSKNVDDIKAAIQMSDKEYNEYAAKLNKLRNAILEKYPDVKAAYLLNNECKGCNLEKSTGYLSSIVDPLSKDKDIITRESFLKKHQNFKAAPEAGCQWVKYIACLAVCTSTGPVLYWICAALCIDTYCNF